jgi:hypothetical protein
MRPDEAVGARDERRAARVRVAEIRSQGGELLAGEGWIGVAGLHGERQS